jgi:uncharacterized protein YidB (DUF937 family)
MTMLGKIAWGVLAVIAYRNRDRLAEWMKRALPPRATDNSNDGSLIQRLAQGFASRGSLGILLNELRRAGAEEGVASWVDHGPNLPLAQHHVREVIDQESLQELSKHTGLNEEELVERLARELPNAVDRLTPEGRLPQAFTNQLGAGPTYGKLDQEPAEGGRDTIDRQLARRSDGSS